MLEANTVLKRYFKVLEELPNAERRPAQEKMIVQVADALSSKQSLVIEAGTGSGKSFGYLIPALLQEKRPVVISTATIALQEQLINKDLPAIIETLNITNAEGEPPLIKLVKGRGNYLCVQKLLEFERHIRPGTPDYLMLQYLKGEWQDDWDGDVGTLELTVPFTVWNEVRSDAEDCLGRRCQFFRDNPYRIAREDLEQADIIVANHALYLQDIAAASALLPPHEVVIFDEAHQIKNYALNAFTVRIGRYATTKLLQKIQRRLQPIPDEAIRAISDIEANIMEWLFRRKQETFRLYPDDLLLHWIDREIDILSDLEQWLGGIDVKQLTIVETDLDADKAMVQKNNLISQLHGLVGRWQYFMEISEQPKAIRNSPRVNWVETKPDSLYFELKSTPLDVSQYLSDALWNNKTAILTSATLAVNKTLDFFKSDLGIPTEARDSVLPSPFDYVDQCLLYLPDHMPDPNSQEYLAHCSEEIEKLLAITQGRAFVLFTSNQAMHTVSNALIPRVSYPCEVQGELPRQRMIDWFKATPNSVVFATSTFWEGIDIPGESLSCVIMDKIPFGSPGDPVNSAMVDYIKNQFLLMSKNASGADAEGESRAFKKRDWFSDFVLPQAVIKMKQGFGRLIRAKTDRGIVAILDPRLKTKGYGKIIRRSLPQCRALEDLATLEAEFLSMTNPMSFTDICEAEENTASGRLVS